MIPRYLVNYDTDNIEKVFTEAVVVGSGIAGLTAALEISKQFDVAVVTKGELKETATWYAQGGVATAVSQEDSPKLHYRDTLEAGAGLCDREAVSVLVSEGPDRIGDLIRMGAQFDWQGDHIGLSREGGHSLARVLHSGDSTGSEIEATLIRTANAWQSVQVFEHRFSIDLLVDKGRCVGVLTFDEPTGRIIAHFAKAVILATGGAGQLYSVTTNPTISTGDGIAMAYRAGAVLADMEFIQFHPTALDRDAMPRFLITEALRGEGAYLRDCNGERFMVGRHPLAELAPRDVVTREMVQVMERCHDKPVYLDATHISESLLRERYPNIWSRCREVGIDISKDLIPVRPAAHYTVGGVRTDLNGETNIAGLYATGETSCTGVHGANRLASNSLLEGLVFSKRISMSVMRKLAAEEDQQVEDSRFKYSADKPVIDIDIAAERRWLQKLMTDYAGVVRNEEGLLFALSEVNRKDDILKAGFMDPAGFELQNMLCIAGLLIRSALTRKESRGVHYRDDYPEPSDRWLIHLENRYTEDMVAG